ncbi:unnamed protein product [Arabis nemorensis]|uniref:Rrn7/TAF1B N-terminal cyclin domain-containing protein n=1 Tax=Arabis nemorensis TaxID=586526 RepID=A0A565BRC3_9BRAS|nr:unnamed protein product [Arabis nemorensis]
MICKECDREDEFDEDEDGFFYCVCGTRAPGIIATAVADEDFIGDDGGTRGALYNPINTRRRPSQPTTPAHPRYDEETMRYSQFRSQLQSATTTQIPQSATNQNREVKREPENLDNEPIEPADFGATSLEFKDYYGETRDRYVNGFLMMITYQCDALVEKFNVTPLIIGLVAPICLRYVALSGVFDEGWADKAIDDSELQFEGEEQREAKRNRHGGEIKNIGGKRAIMIWISELRKCMPLSSTLAISFLACLKAGAPVLPTDIVRWAREGKIPYLSSFLKIKEQMGERSAACPVPVSVMFRPHKIVSAQMLEVRAALIADIIGLPLPPVNFYGIASNYLNRLCIPEDKVLDLVRLIQNWSMPPDLYLSKNKLKLPTRVCVMSIIIVAIRMLYNINGFGVWERSLGSDGASEATSEADADVDSEEPDSPIDDMEISETKSAAAESSEFTKAAELDTEELLTKLEARYHEVVAETLEYEKDLMSYLSHGKKEIFAGLEEESADDRYRTIDKLWNGYPENEESQRLGTPSKRLRDWDDDLLLNQLSLDGTSSRYSDGNNPCRSPSMRTESGSMDHDQCSSEHHISSPETHNEEEKSKEGMIRRLKTDMGENLFRYIPPRVRVKRLDYLQYVRKREDGVLIYPAHADYYILLRVCAKVAEIDARNMHRGVLSFERRLAWIEKRIDQVLHITPPFMTCEHCCNDSKVVEAEDRDDNSSDNKTDSRT